MSESNPLRMRVWNLPQRAKEMIGNFDEFFRVPEMSMGIFKLNAGDRDLQAPHMEDEVYYILSGKAIIVTEGESRPVAPGDAIFIPAQAQHAFTNVEDVLEVLVIFVPAYNSRQNPIE